MNVRDEIAATVAQIEHAERMLPNLDGRAHAHTLEFIADARAAVERLERMLAATEGMPE